MINKLEMVGTIIKAAGLGLIGAAVICMILTDIVYSFTLLGQGIMVYAVGMFIKTVSQLINYFKQ